MVTHIRKLACVSLIVALTGCSDDGPPPEPPKVVKPEPKSQIVLNVADFPAIEYAYFVKTQANVTNIYQVAVDSTTITRVNTSDAAQFHRPEVFLGESRYTTAWAFMEDGGRLFRLDPTHDAPTQISSLNTKLCHLGSFQDGVGLSSLTLVVQAAGADGLCDTSDDTWYETPADAAPTDEAVASQAYRLNGAALNGADGSLSGFALADATGIILYNTRGEDVGALGTTSGTLRTWRRGDGDFWVVRGTDVYRVPASLFSSEETGVTSASQIHAFPQVPVLVESVPVSAGSDHNVLLAVVGTSVVTIGEDGTVTALVSDLSGTLDTPESLAAHSDGWFYIQGQHSGSETLIAINRSNGNVVSVTGNLKGEVAALNGYLFYSTHDGTDYTGHVWSEATQSDTTTLNNSRWVRMPVYTEDGLETRLLRFYLFDDDPDDGFPAKRILSWVEPTTLKEYVQYGQLPETSDVLDHDAANRVHTLMLIYARSLTSEVNSVYSLNLSARNALKGTSISISVDESSGEGIRFR